MKRVCLDTSAFLAVLFKEPGSKAVLKACREADYAFMSSANLSEVIQKVLQKGGTEAIVNRVGYALAIHTRDFTEADARRAAHLWRKGFGLSLADRACLSMAYEMVPADVILTADRVWEAASKVLPMYGVTVEVIR